MAFPKRVPTRWLATAAARLAFLSGVGYVAMAYSVSRYLTRPRRRRIKHTPAEFGLPCEHFSFTAADGIALSGWLVEPANPRGTVALFHGMRRNREQMLARIAFLHAAGFRCVAIDHRAHGGSGGKRISFGWYEARDVQALAKWIEERFAAQPRFALGISMGAAAVCFAGPTCGWSKVVLEGIYADLAVAFKRRIGGNFPRWFTDLYPAVIWITQKRLRMRIEQLRPVEAITRFQNIPVLGVTGDKDLVAPLGDVQAVAGAATPAGELLIIPGAGHNDMCETGGERYQQRILGFRVLRTFRP